MPAPAPAALALLAALLAPAPAAQGSPQGPQGPPYGPPLGPHGPYGPRQEALVDTILWLLSKVPDRRAPSAPDGRGAQTGLDGLDGQDAQGADAAAGPTTLEEVLVVVNGHIITGKAYQQAAEQQAAEVYRRFSGRELDEKLEGAREKALQDLIDTFVLLDVAAEKEMFSYAPTEAEFLADLKGRVQAASDADLERMVKAELGVTLGEFIRQQRQTYVIESLLYQEVYRKVPVEEQEARLYYNEHQADYRQAARFRVRELVIPKAGGGYGPDGAGGPGAAETLAAVREGLEAGAPFEDLVRRHSGSPSSGLGGDLGWTGLGILLPAVEEAALALAPDEVSGPIETDKDFIIVQLVALEAEGAKPFQEVRGQIVAKLQEPKAKNALQLYLQAQRLRANVRYMVPKERILKGRA